MSNAMVEVSEVPRLASCVISLFALASSRVVAFLQRANSPPSLVIRRRPDAVGERSSRRESPEARRGTGAR
jgi:hypothetical protein